MDIRIVQLDLAALRALAAGDLAAADAASPVPLTGYLAGPEPRSVWRASRCRCRTGG